MAFLFTRDTLCSLYSLYGAEGHFVGILACLASEVKLSSWTGAVCYFIDPVQPSIECEDYRQAFYHENHTTRYI